MTAFKLKENFKMALTTFGAIMGFAAEMTEEAARTYETLLQKAKHPALREAFQSLMSEAKKNQSLMEQTRRENVTEMILEPIDGFDREAYRLLLNLSNAMEDRELLRTALLLEEREKKFFLDASSKVPLPEVARFFRKMGQRKDKHLNHLLSIQLSS